MKIETLELLYNNSEEKGLHGRYICNDHIAPFLVRFKDYFLIENIGDSVQKRSIHGIKVGSGVNKVLIWSQMHGNESTTTKVIFDLLNAFISIDDQLIDTILDNCTLYIIPILNPDGAQNYTRENANGIDLNRDAQELSQPESIILKDVFDKFQPDFCLNLHGQRTIFSAGKTNKPATVSFLAPAQDKAASLTNNRKSAMAIIVRMNEVLQKVIPGQVGVYDDAFNLNCVGDTFQRKGVPTILFEAGHYANDYDREITRKYVFYALITALDSISNTFMNTDFSHYFDIPENEKCLYDIIIRNARLISKGEEMILDLGILYTEILNDKQIDFIPKLVNISDLSNYYGHKELDANKNKVFTSSLLPPELDSEIDCVVINSVEFSLKLNDI